MVGKIHFIVKRKKKFNIKFLNFCLYCSKYGYTKINYYHKYLKYINKKF